MAFACAEKYNKMSNISKNLLKETSPFRLLRIVSTDFLALRSFCLMYASTAAKSYILNCMWTAADFIIKGRMAAGCAPLL